jgi:phosphate transport system permease protein
MKKFLSKFFISLSGLASLIIVGIVLIILGNILYYGIPNLSINFLISSPEAGMTKGGIFPAIFGTFALVILMTILVIPLGVATAVYLNEYSNPDSKIVYLLRIAIQNLAGVPSIVYGLFGLGFFVHFLGGGIDKIFFSGELNFGQPAIIWASATLAVLTLPTVIVSTEEALRAVPNNLREIAYSLGATKWQTIRYVVLPNAVSGILTGSILAISRGSGEVAPVMFTGAAYYLPYLPTRLNDQFMELGYHIYVMSTQSPDVEKTKPILYSTVVVLLILTFSLNLVAVLIRAKVRKRLRKC